MRYSNLRPNILCLPRGDVGALLLRGANRRPEVSRGIRAGNRGAIRLRPSQYPGDHITCRSPAPRCNNLEIMARISKRIDQLTDTHEITSGGTEPSRMGTGNNKIMFSPEFLRESRALCDNLYPSRIFARDATPAAHMFSKWLLEGRGHRTFQSDSGVSTKPSDQAVCQCVNCHVGGLFQRVVQLCPDTHCRNPSDHQSAAEGCGGLQVSDEVRVGKLPSILDPRGYETD